MVTRVAAAVVLTTAVGCGRSAPAPTPAVTPVADSWYAPAPPGSSIDRLDPDRFAPVVGPLQDEAQASLADAPTRRLAAPEAARLVGRELPAGGAYVLLRAVILREQNGGYSVRAWRGAVEVQHWCLGRSDGPMTRRAVVVVLPEMPAAAYATCGWYP